MTAPSVHPGDGSGVARPAESPAGTITLAPEPARIDALGAALAGLWRREEQRSEPLSLSRCLTINLIAVADADREPELREAVQRVLLRHPARVFLLLRDPQAHTLSAATEAQVRKHGNTRVLVLEQLDLRVGGAHLGKVPGLIRPLLVNDIPVHLFWCGPLPEDVAPMRLLAKMADSVVVDSSRFRDPAGDLEHLEQLRPVPVRDLTWYRLASWRRALAEAFETFEWSPKTPTRAVIEHAPMPAALAASLVLREWLRSKLDARVQLVALSLEGGAGATCSAAESQDGAARQRVADEGEGVTRCGSDPAGAPPALEPARLSLEHGRVRIEVTHLSPEACLRVDVTMHDQCLVPFHRPASRGAPGDLLAAALDA